MAQDRLAAVEALEASSQALLTSRHFVPSYLARAALCAELGEAERAHTLYTEAFQSLGDVAWPFMLGQCHLAFGRFLFQKYWLGVEIASFLLFVALVGALYLGRGDGKMEG